MSKEPAAQLWSSSKASKPTDPLTNQGEKCGATYEAKKWKFAMENFTINTLIETKIQW